MRALKRLGTCIGLLLAGGILVVCGCEGPHDRPGSQRSAQRAVVREFGPVEEPQSIQVVVGRVNRNSAAMDFLLRAGGVSAKGEYVEKGKREPFDLRGTLLYRRPRDLYLQLQHALGGTFEIGSNSEEFWVWKRLGNDRYWWGSQAAVDANQELEMPLRPTDIVEVLGLGELSSGSGDRSLFKVTSDRYDIRVPAQDRRGKPYIAKVISVDRRSPFLVREMVYFSADARPRVDARLSNYYSIDGSTVLIPHRIEINWPQRGGYMDLEFGTVKQFQSEAASKRFVSPVQQGRDVGPRERVDGPMPTPAGNPARGAR